MESMHRRTLLRWGTGLLAVPWLHHSLASAFAPALQRSKQRPRRLVLLWLEGGPSQMETFDPKPGTVTGGPVGALETDVQGWRFSAHLPLLCDRAESLSVLRAVHSKEGNHSRARELVKTGYTPNPTVSFPSLGSMVADELGDADSELPSYVQIGGAPSPAGYLGVEAAPYVLSKAEKKIEHLDYARGVDAERMDRRERSLELLEEGFADRGGAEAVASYRSLRLKARRLTETKLRSAFDLDAEKESLRDRYGRHDFGQGCLLARRLLDAGVSAVEVVLGGWDTHQDNFARTGTLGAQLDSGFATLLDDLKSRSLLENTLVVCMGEFGRTPKITAEDGRGHWPRNFCAALAGASLHTGLAHGTTDESGENIVDGAVTVADLHATIAKSLGLDLDREDVVNGRPVTRVDPTGRPISEILRSS